MAKPTTAELARAASKFGNLYADRIFTDRMPKSGVRKGMKSTMTQMSEQQLAWFLTNAWMAAATEMAEKVAP